MRNSNRRTRHVFAVALCLGGKPVLAAETDVLHYTARLHGVALLDVTLCLRLDIDTYAAGITARTIGLTEMLVHGRSTGHVTGAIDGVTVKPRDYAEHSRLSGEDYAAVIAYPAGIPQTRTLVPPQEKYRVPVPPADLPGAIDGLSAVALASLVATRTGACQADVLVFDGRQLRRTATRMAGRDTLPPNPRSVFSGPALKCQTDSVMVAGFIKNDPVRPQQRPRHSTAWMGPASPGGPDVPVRVSSDADFLGDIIVDLDAVSHAPGPACDGAIDAVHQPEQTGQPASPR